MSHVLRPLAFADRYGRLLLVAGLVAGLFVPSAAAAVRPHVGELIAALLFLACLRIGPQQAVGVAADFRVGLKATFVLQLLLPLALVAFLHVSGSSGPTTIGLTLLAAASPLAGSPNLAAMVGSDPAPALRQLVVGTALLPLTALVVFLFASGIGPAGALFVSSGRLLLVIAGAALLGFGIRLTILKDLSTEKRDAIDGCSAIVMAVVVVGLMAAIGETWRHDPQAVLLTGAVACIVNLGLQVATALVLLKAGARHIAVPLAISAGNRNVALFLTALPAATTDATLLFIGCYQIPMYLTPLILGRWYRRIAQAGRRPAITPAGLGH